MVAVTACKLASELSTIESSAAASTRAVGRMSVAIRDILAATDAADETDGEEVVCVCACTGLRVRRKGKTALLGRLEEDKHSGHSHTDDDDDDEDDDDPVKGGDVAGEGDEGVPEVTGAYTACFSRTSCDRTASRSMRSRMRRCRGPLGHDTTSRSAEAGRVGGGDEAGPDETTRTTWSCYEREGSFGSML